MSSFGKKQIAPRDTGAERRRNERDSISLVGTLNTPAKSRSANLVDVSASGAQICGRDLPKVGEFVKLRVNGFAIFATVAWCAEGKCGLHFDEKLNAGMLQELVHASEQDECLDFEISPLELQNSLRKGTNVK